MATKWQYESMWLQALELADEAQRLQRRFLRYLGPADGAISWEAPVDILETEEGVLLVFALPGVSLDDIEVHLERATLTVRAIRRISPGDGRAIIRRLEIPYGRFVRQVSLAGRPMQIGDWQYINGCLQVRLVNAEGRT